MSKRDSRSAHQRLISVESCNGQFRVRCEKLPSRATLERLASRWSSFPDTDELFRWVSTDKSEGAARVNRILELIVEQSELKRASGDEEEHLLRWQGRVVKVKVNLERGFPLGAVFLPAETKREARIRLELGAKLERYKLRPYYAAQIGDYPILGWRSAEDWPEGEDDPSEDVWFTELDAILLISDLARAGLWRKIRRCQHCRVWLLAKFSIRNSALITASRITSGRAKTTKPRAAPT